jgi:hypothetical protein
MSLHPQEVPPVPEETRRVARAAFPRGHVFLRMRDALGTIDHDHLFAHLFPARGQPAEAPWRLALTTVTSLTRTTCTARDTLPNGRHDNRPALGVAIGAGGRCRPVCLASAGSRLVSGHARQGRRIMRRPVRAVRACRQDPDWPGAAAERAVAAFVACRFVVPVWPRDQEDGLRP